PFAPGSRCGMSTTEHERIEELLAVRALGGLETGDLAEYDRLRTEHGLDCEVCMAAELEFDEIAGRLAFTLGPVAVPEGMEDRLMDLALEAFPAAEPSEVAVPSVEPPVEAGPTPGTPADVLAERRERRRPPRIARIITAVAAAIILVAGAFAGGFLAGGGGSSGGTQQEQALAVYLSNPDTQVVRFQATEGGNLAVAYQ